LDFGGNLTIRCAIQASLKLTFVIQARLELSKSGGWDVFGEANLRPSDAHVDAVRVLISITGGGLFSQQNYPFRISKKFQVEFLWTLPTRRIQFKS